MQYRKALVGCVFFALSLPAFAGVGPAATSPDKPEIQTILKPKSITRIMEDRDVITNSEWAGDGDEDFQFVNATLIRAPMRYARPKIMDFSLYPKMSSALKKFE